MTDTITLEKNDPPGGEPTEAELARARKEHIGRYVAIFVMPFLMVGMMITGYLYAMHAPAPQDMPIAVQESHEDALAFGAVEILDALNGAAVAAWPFSVQLHADPKPISKFGLADEDASPRPNFIDRRLRQNAHPVADVRKRHSHLQQARTAQPLPR